MSLSEIASEYGISRQGVHDLLKRCDKILLDYEEKLHLVKKFQEAKEKVSKIITLTEGCHGSQEEMIKILMEIRQLSAELYNEL